MLATLRQWRARYAAEGFAPVRAAWLDAAHRPEEPLGVSAGASEGLFRGLGADGSLLLDGSDGAFAVASGKLA